jgi:hypothetical protein
VFATVDIQTLAFSTTGTGGVVIKVSGTWVSSTLSLFCTVIPAIALGPFVAEFLTAVDVLMLMASLLLLPTPLSLAVTAVTGEPVVSGVPFLLASLLLSLMLLISYC